MKLKTTQWTSCKNKVTSNLTPQITIGGYLNGQLFSGKPNASNNHGIQHLRGSKCQDCNLR